MIMLISYLDSQCRLFHIILNFGLVIAIAFIDFSMAHEVSFGLFYLVPVSLSAWFLGNRYRHAALIFTAFTWLVVEIIASQSYINPVSAYWSATERFVIFVLVAILITWMRNAYQYQTGLARTDHLTGVANSRAFFEAAQTEISRARRYAHPLTIAYMDIDDFKAVNDRYGHGVGDQLLKKVCEVAEGGLRETDLLARLGGDEFAIMLPETGEEAAQVVFQKMQKTLLGEMRNHGWDVTFSIGVVTCLEPPNTVAEVVKWSDDLVYKAKSSGKNTIKNDVFPHEFFGRRIKS